MARFSTPEFCPWPVPELQADFLHPVTLDADPLFAWFYRVRAWQIDVALGYSGAADGLSPINGTYVAPHKRAGEDDPADEFYLVCADELSFSADNGIGTGFLGFSLFGNVTAETGTWEKPSGVRLPRLELSVQSFDDLVFAAFTEDDVPSAATATIAGYNIPLFERPIGVVSGRHTGTITISPATYWTWGGRFNAATGLPT